MARSKYMTMTLINDINIKFDYLWPEKSPHFNFLLMKVAQICKPKVLSPYFVTNHLCMSFGNSFSLQVGIFHKKCDKI